MRRAAESLLESYLETFPCVAVLGVRQCGKTTLLQTLPASWKQFDVERRADHAVISRDPDAFFRLNPRRVAIDEAQHLPEIFSALRVAIDEQRGEKGRFVITGSSSPSLVRSVSESLAGRVAIIELSPLSWEEVTGTVGRDSLLSRLGDRTASPADLIAGLAPRGTPAEVLDYWYRGGFPEPWLESKPTFRSRWIEQYIQTYILRDVKRLFPALDDTRFRRFLEMLGGLSGRILNYAEVARALGVSQPTARDYLDIAHGTFVWRTIPAFSRNVVKRVVKHPRGYLRDTGLLHALLRIPDSDSLLSHPQVGASWEGMVVEEVMRQFAGMGEPVEASYYRTSGGAEVDLVVEGDFGGVAFDIKHASVVSARDLRGLRDFVSEQGMRVGIVVNNDAVPRQYDDHLIGIPFAWL
ncbi:ATP-binding protein [Gemmatimonas sp.]|uniref:ATP-binding protein n=1 Tax=Gemmatimonas sp. TaxID=1962908 RepID=UPI00356B5077